MSIKFNDLEIFIAIVEAKAISRAADNLDVPKSHVSRHLKELEEGLNRRLLDRTTRRISVFAPVDFMSRVLGEFSRCYPSLGGNKPTTDALGARGGHAV
jgi:hypothetical protein